MESLQKARVHTPRMQTRSSSAFHCRHGEPVGYATAPPSESQDICIFTACPQQAARPCSRNVCATNHSSSRRRDRQQVYRPATSAGCRPDLAHPPRWHMRTRQLRAQAPRARVSEAIIITTAWLLLGACARAAAACAHPFA